MNKPYDHYEDPDSVTKEQVDETRRAQAAVEAAERASSRKRLLDAMTPTQDLGVYEDSQDYKCVFCGRAKPCRHHKDG